MFSITNLKKLTIAVIAATAVWISCSPESHADTIIVPTDYMYIQDAINDPLADIVLVMGGTYTEDILMRDGVMLVGGGRDETKIVGTVTMANNSVLKRIVIENFTGDGVVINSQNVTIKNVVIHVNNTGINLNGASAVTIENNTIHSLNGPCINSQTSNYVLRNNILTLEDTTKNAINANSGTPEILYNCILGKISPATLSHKGTISASPGYVDALNGDFHLAMAIDDNMKSPSVAMDSGDPLSDYSFELQEPNNAVDLGAYGNTREAPVGVDALSVPEEYPTINAAIAASTSGRIISLAPGVYNENVILPTGVSLIGSGKEITTVNGKVEVGSNSRVIGITFAYEIPDSNIHYLLKVFASNVTVKYCAFRLSYSGTSYMNYNNRLAYLSGSYITLAENDLSFVSLYSRFIYGIYTWQCPNLKMKGNRIYIKDNTLGTSFIVIATYFAYPKDTVLENNIIHVEANRALHLYGINLATYGTVYDNALVKNNTIYLKSNNTSTYNRYVGINSSGLAHFNARNNIIDFHNPQTGNPYYYYTSYYSIPFYIYYGTTMPADNDISLTYNFYNGATNLVYVYPSNLNVTQRYNIKANPDFVDIAKGDFHLKPTSIAIDRGDPADDYSKEPQPNGGRINCGAYGNTPEATTTTATVLTRIIFASAEQGGFIYPRGSISVPNGGSQTFTITPSYYYEIQDVLIDGTPQTLTGNTYTFENVTSDHTIVARFKEKPYHIITASVAGYGGYIYPSGSVKVIAETSQTFRMQSGYGYYVEDVVVDGTSVGPKDSHTFTNVTEDHTIQAKFVQGGVVTATAGPGGTISPEGRITVGLGKPLSFTIKPDNYYYKIKDVYVDGYSVGPVEYYTFGSVYGSHTIKAVFSIKTYYLSTFYEGEGQVTKNPDLDKYEYGANVRIDAIPASGYYFSHWEGDINYISGGNYYESSITVYMYDNISLKAVFRSD